MLCFGVILVKHLCAHCILTMVASTCGLLRVLCGINFKYITLALLCFRAAYYFQSQSLTWFKFHAGNCAMRNIRFHSSEFILHCVVQSHLFVKFLQVVWILMCRYYIYPRVSKVSCYTHYFSTFVFSITSCWINNLAQTWEVFSVHLHGVNLLTSSCEIDDRDSLQRIDAAKAWS